jgi:S-adenosylmethionine decarboxylase
MQPSTATLSGGGREWVVEAYGCDPVRLGDLDTLQSIFAAMTAELDLHPVAHAQWHRFPSPGGVTGLLMLAESHLTVHTFPEHASLCLNLFCCTPRPAWQWQQRLAQLIGARDVRVRTFERHYALRAPSSFHPAGEVASVAPVRAGAPELVLGNATTRTAP